MRFTRITLCWLTLLAAALVVQAQTPLEATLEKEGCATLDESQVRICKYDYVAHGKKVEGFTIRPLAEGKYPGLVLLAGREGARTFFTFGRIFAQQGFACVAISEPGFGKSDGKPDFMGRLRSMHSRKASENSGARCSWTGNESACLDIHAAAWPLRC